MGLLRARLLSFGMILGIAFLLMVSLVLERGDGRARQVVGRLLRRLGDRSRRWSTCVVGFVLVTAGVFAMIYKLMPRVQVRWHDVWIGAVVTAALFTVGKFLIGLYIGKSGVASGFGAAGSLVVIFVWVYYSAQIFLLGAEFTWVYARTFGSMRSLSESAKEARDSDLPSRSEDAPVPAAPPVVALAPRPIVARPRRKTEPALAQPRHRPGGGGGVALHRAAAAAPALSPHGRPVPREDSQ